MNTYNDNKNFVETSYNTINDLKKQAVARCKELLNCYTEKNPLQMQDVSNIAFDFPSTVCSDTYDICQLQRVWVADGKICGDLYNYITDENYDGQEIEGEDNLDWFNLLEMLSKHLLTEI